MDPSSFDDLFNRFFFETEGEETLSHDLIQTLSHNSRATLALCPRQGRWKSFLWLCRVVFLHFIKMWACSTMIKMAFDGHFNVMSHIFPQLIQTAAVVAFQILMTDLACDVALQSSVLSTLWDTEPEEHSQSGWFSGEVFINRTAASFCRRRNVEPLALQFPHCSLLLSLLHHRNRIWGIYKDAVQWNLDCTQTTSKEATKACSHIVYLD